MRGEYNHPGLGAAAQNAHGRGQPVDAGHDDVHEHDVRLEGERLMDGLLSILGLADDSDVSLPGKSASKNLAE